MKIWLWGIVCLAGMATQARAGAWPQVPGHTQVITSIEPGGATQAFDAAGVKSIRLGTWEETNATLYIDHGLSPRVSLTAQLNYKSYDTGTTRFSGLGSVELGGRFMAHKGDDYVLAFGVRAEGLGRARRYDFDSGTRQGTDYDLRAYWGRNLSWRGYNGFINLEVARHLRQYEANQWRLDATIGLKMAEKAMFMAQVFAGQTDQRMGYQSKWLNAEISMVHTYGPASLQLGVRKTITGRNVPATTALIVSLWRNF